MDRLDRRSTLTFFGMFAALATGLKPAAARAMDMDMTAGKETTLAPGVVMRVYSEGPAIIPGYQKVSLRDIIVQPGAKTTESVMKNPMVCHMTEGELRVVRDGNVTFTARKNFVWTCAKDTREQVFNDGNAVAIMRITDLMA